MFSSKEVSDDHDPVAAQYEPAFCEAGRRDSMKENILSRSRIQLHRFMYLHETSFP